MIAPTIKPPAIASRREPINHVRARVSGTGINEYVPNPMGKPVAMPNRKPYFSPEAGDFGDTKTAYKPANVAAPMNVTKYINPIFICATGRQSCAVA